MTSIKIYEKIFSDAELKKVCQIIADTSDGLTGSEIGMKLKKWKIKDEYPDITKWKRLFNALAKAQYLTKSGKIILNFIKDYLDPVNFIKDNILYELKLHDLNTVLIFRGIEFRADGKAYKVKEALTLSEAEIRADRLAKQLRDRNVHDYILKFCKAELLQNNYFHAVLEACKGIASFLRDVSGSEKDGASLVDEVLGGNDPVIKINSFDTETKRSEQRGFNNIAKGLFGTFRNPTSHAAKIEWEMTEEDALDLFVLASYVYRRVSRGCED